MRIWVGWLGAACFSAFVANPARTQVQPQLEFEAASIRPAPDPLTAIRAGERPHTGTGITGARVDIGSASLMLLVTRAYGLRDEQVDGPGWMSSDLFNILATMPAGAGEAQLPEMLQALLKDRFKLAAHTTSKEQSVYLLRAGKGGVKMTRSYADPNPIPTSREDVAKLAAARPPGSPTRAYGTGFGGRTVFWTSNGIRHTEFGAITLHNLADWLTLELGRPVLDQTGLDGTYHAILAYAAGGEAAASRIPRTTAGDESAIDAVSDPPGNSVFKAVESLGLKLESGKGPVDHLVIDHIEKAPPAN